ncbi:MAG: hypothetical protein ACYTGM_19550, partial [Planctomycetota bacterium]
MSAPSGNAAVELLSRAQALRRRLSGSFRDELVEALYDDAKTIADRAVRLPGGRQWDWDQRIDRLLTSPV